jgi:hypothetical protein
MWLPRWGGHLGPRVRRHHRLLIAEILAWRREAGKHDEARQTNTVL